MYSPLFWHDVIIPGDVTVNNTLLDGDNRAFKVYYANGDVAWG